MKKKVTVLSPCYNVENYVHRLIESVISQDYLPLELILVNDGSTDNTESVILSYKRKLAEIGIEFKYIYKENGGQASAIALGLKEVTGDYLIWPDADDFLLKDSIRKRVDFLQKNPQFAWVRSNGYNYSEDLEIINIVDKKKKNLSLYKFDDFIDFKILWPPISYMIDMHKFDKANPERKIFDSKCGQNIQMMFPIAYLYECPFLNENLFGYLIRENSHSRFMRSLEDDIKHIDNLELTVKETVKMIEKTNNVNLKNYILRSENFFSYRRFYSSWVKGDRKKIQVYYDILKSKKALNLSIFLMKNFKFSKFMTFVIRVCDKFFKLTDFRKAC